MREFLRRFVPSKPEVGQKEYQVVLRQLRAATEETFYRTSVELEDQLYSFVVKSPTMHLPFDIPQDLRDKFKTTFWDAASEHADIARSSVTTGILTYFDVIEGRNILRKGLLEAKTYWEDKLNEKVISQDAAIFGRRRIMQINQRLEDLNKPQSQS